MESFLVTYACELCGEEVELSNCKVPFITIPCDFCGSISRFVSSEITYFNMDWDFIED